MINFIASIKSYSKKRKDDAEDNKIEQEKKKAQEEFEIEQEKINYYKEFVKITLANGGRRFSKYYYNKDIPWDAITTAREELKSKTDWSMTWHLSDVSRETCIGFQEGYKLDFCLHHKVNIVELPKSF